MAPTPKESSRADLVRTYHSQADSALGHAENASSSELKDLYLRVAECWRTLAKFETLALGANV